MHSAGFLKLMLYPWLKSRQISIFLFEGSVVPIAILAKLWNEVEKGLDSRTGLDVPEIQACGVLRAVEPLNAFLASLCKFALVPQNDSEKTSATLISASGKRPDVSPELKDVVVLTPKNVQALRTIFNIAHRLDTVLGSSWTLVLETLALLDRVIHSPHATTQEVSAVVPRFSRDLSTQSSDFNILSTLDSQLFESSAFMSTSAVSSLLTALRQVSNESLMGVTSGFGQAISGVTTNMASSVGGTIQPTLPKMFAVERMVATLVNNLHSKVFFWPMHIFI
ncbi:hypothetical protein L7F22_005964 [Adiantum nelumboides]|nr:hypothetical protein [Adiantum nelumboides]